MLSSVKNYSVTDGDRVRRHTAQHLNEDIDRATEQSVGRYAHRAPWEIEQRIRELDREWDVERALEVNASTLSLTGLVLGMAVNRKWFALPAVVLPFLFQHGMQGWCPPLPVLRRMGFRTRGEIDHEKYQLQALLDQYAF